MAYPIIDALTGLGLMSDGVIYDNNSQTAAILQQPSEQLMYYEVIRLIDGVPLFWEDHLARLEKSINGKIELDKDLQVQCRRLLDYHSAQSFELNRINLRIVITPDLQVIHLIPSYYPSDEQFAEGVPVMTLDWERDNPNIKVIKSDYKVAVAAGFARQNKYGRPFELLLADHYGNYTEGSRSNLFFIRDGEVLSAPEDKILLGITRKYVIDAIRQAGFKLRTNMISKQELANNPPEAAFLSGSPIDLLPISAIDDYPVNSAGNQMFMTINAAYTAILNDYTSARSSYWKTN